MKTIYLAMIASALLMSATAACIGSAQLMEKPAEELSRELVYSRHDFTREVLADCPIEKAEFDEETQELTISYPREEYRHLLWKLERQGWVEQGEASGRYALGEDSILVSRGELVILPRGLACR